MVYTLKNAENFNFPHIYTMLSQNKYYDYYSDEQITMFKIIKNCFNLQSKYEEIVQQKLSKNINHVILNRQLNVLILLPFKIYLIL